MATLTFAYDHSRDPMNPDDLGDKIAASLGLTTPPIVDINASQIVVTHASIAAGNTAAIQALISAYVLDATRAGFGPGVLGMLLNKAKNAIAANNTFLAISSPTQAQTLAQVQLLTRENTAIIKIMANQLADTSGT